MLNKFKQFCIGSIVTVSCLTLGLLPASARKTVIYDFTKPEAKVLQGKVEAQYTVDGIPLGIKVGIINSQDNFILGGKGAKLSIDDSLIETYNVYRGGLGIVSEEWETAGGQIACYCYIDFDNPDAYKYKYSEAAVFNFDPKFKVKKIHLGQLYGYEDLTIFANEKFLMDFINFDSISYPTLELPDHIDHISSLMMTTFSFFDEESDYYIAAIEGTIETVPEPTLTLGLITLAGMGFLKRRNTNV